MFCQKVHPTQKGWFAEQARRLDLERLDLQTPSWLQAQESWLLPQLAWPLKLLDEMEVQELSECQSWKLEMMLCIICVTGKKSPNIGLSCLQILASPAKLLISICTFVTIAQHFLISFS